MFTYKYADTQRLDCKIFYSTPYYVITVYYFLAVILSCHWSKHGHVTKIFCDIAIRKSVFHGVLTARSIHLFYDVVFVLNPFAAGATVVLISASTWKGKLNVSNQWISRKIIGLGLLQFKLMRMDI